MSNKNLKIKLEELNEQFKNSDRILGKDILTIANKLNGSRSMMFNSHIEQAVILYEPDFPRVFTNYENMVGKYSSSYYQSENNFTIINKISKFKEFPNICYTLVVKDKNGMYDIIERKEAERITESYAYKLENKNIDSKKIGDTIKKDEVLYHSTAYDEEMNFSFGRNANCMYLIENKTIEDAIWCSQSFAEKMSNYYLEEIEITLNNNDILCNLYGKNKKNTYQCFPNIGEETKNNTLVARRRINYDNILFDLQNENLKKINHNTDTVFYAEGTVVDIDIYSNQDITKLENYFYNDQIVDYLKQQQEYHRELFKILDPIVNKNKYSDNLAYTYNRVKNICDPNVKWKNDKSDFDNLVIIFKVMKKNKLHVGSKLTGRFGDKGVVSQISPDNEMPKNQYGETVDIVFNALGIANRLNPAQLYEMELNFISKEIVRKLSCMKSLQKREELFFDFIKDVNKIQYNSLKEYYDSLDKNNKKEFFEDINKRGIYLHQPPFYDNVNFDELKFLYKKYDWIEPYEFTVNGKKLQRRLIAGDKYIMKLKHEPKNKFSARSTSYLNTKNLPSKSIQFKKKKEPHSKTPIRFGRILPFNIVIYYRTLLIAGKS